MLRSYNIAVWLSRCPIKTHLLSKTTSKLPRFMLMWANLLNKIIPWCFPAGHGPHYRCIIGGIGLLWPYCLGQLRGYFWGFREIGYFHRLSPIFDELAWLGLFRALVNIESSFQDALCLTLPRSKKFCHPIFWNSLCNRNQMGIIYWLISNTRTWNTI